MEISSDRALARSGTRVGSSVRVGDGAVNRLAIRGPARSRGPKRPIHSSMDGASHPTTIRAAGAARFPDDPEMAELAELFLEGLAARIAAIREGWEAQDLAQVRFGSHQLRGAAGGYGFPEIGEAAGLVEDLLRHSESEVFETHPLSSEDLAAAIDLLERRHRAVFANGGASERRSP